MVADPSCFTHTGCGKNYLRGILEIDRLGFITRDGKPKPRKCNRINALFHQCHGILIKAVQFIFMENTGCLYCEWTIHINREILMIFYKLLFFDLAEKIQDLLRSPDCKGRNHHVTATVKGLLQNP